MEGEGEEPVGELLHILDALRAVTKKIICGERRRLRSLFVLVIIHQRVG
jgi:hypothetical protein